MVYRACKQTLGTACALIAKIAVGALKALGSDSCKVSGSTLCASNPTVTQNLDVPGVSSTPEAKLSAPGTGAGVQQEESETFAWEAEVGSGQLAGSLRFSQVSASPDFSAEGDFKDMTIGQVSGQLRSGEMSPSQVPVKFVELDGTPLIVNTRSSLALMRAGIPRTQWNLIDVTGDASEVENIINRLAHNNLTSEGTETLRTTGIGKTGSSLR